METKELSGKVQTVLGLIEPEELGITLPHEHLLLDVSFYFVEPEIVRERALAYAPVSMENLSWIKFNRLSNLDDLKLTDEEIAVDEALMFKEAGGETIVELTNVGMGRNPYGLSRISKVTGLNIIMGSGYYIASSHPKDMGDRTEQQIADEIIQDILIGVGESGICAGIIGEIGCSVPLSENEKKVLRASAMAQRHTGAAICIHPSKRDEIVLESIEILRDAGADIGKTMVSHVSYSCFQMETLYKLADMGCYLAIDNFGRPVVPFPFHIFGRHQDAPSETQRIDTLIQLINKGYIEQILISVDTCLKQNLVTYGGNGYAHILRNVVPWVREKGITEEQLFTILVKNPARILSFSKNK